MFKTPILSLAIANCIAVSPLSAQTVLTMPGKRVEVVGLRRWTIAMIQDSLRKYADGIGLDSHACAAALRYKLGFADASATDYGVWRGDSLRSVFVAVVEPQDSSRVHYRAAPMDTTAFRPEWAAVARLIDRHMGELMFVLDAGSRRTGAARAVPRGLDSAAAAEISGFLASHASVGDERVARQIIVSDPNDRTRVVAAAILARFTSSDSDLTTLVEAMLESDGRVKQVAGHILFNVTQDEPRPVDWRNAADALHAILDGTSLFLAHTTMDMLVATRVTSSLASPLLRNGGRTVLDFLGAQHPWPRESAHRLLMALSGRDFGYDVDRWRQWIAQL